MREVGPLGLWCLHDGYRYLRVEALVEGFVEEANRLGVPIDRLMITMRTLHPVLTAMGIFCERGQPVSVREYHRAGLGNAAYKDSPVRPILEGEEALIHRPLRDAAAAADFPITRELFERGFTDYLALCLLAGDLRPNVITFATRQPGGFAPEEVAALRDALPAFQAVFDRHALRAIARNVCTTYIGPVTGPRVLGGDIERGAIRRLRAAVWFSDVRGFTAHSLSLGVERTVELLNGFFGALGASVRDEAGEILKFIGDAALVIFPVEDGDDAAACRRALSAVRRTRADVEAFNAGWDGPPVRFGAGLHLGEVAYGNIGAADRLDFTVIGPAVNLAARLEGLCATLGEQDLASEAFAAASGLDFEDLGLHSLKGIEGAQRVLRPT